MDIEAHSDEDSGDDSLEEYEWAGQTRVRIAAGSSLARAGFAVARKKGGGAGGGGPGQESSESDGELDIEEDETQMYGAAQYPFLCYNYSSKKKIILTPMTIILAI